MASRGKEENAFHAIHSTLLLPAIFNVQGISQEELNVRVPQHTLHTLNDAPPQTASPQARTQGSMTHVQLQFGIAFVQRAKRPTKLAVWCEANKHVQFRKQLRRACSQSSVIRHHARARVRAPCCSAQRELHIKTLPRNRVEDALEAATREERKKRN